MFDVGIELHNYNIIIRKDFITFINKTNGEKVRRKVLNSELLLQLEDCDYPQYVKKKIKIHISDNRLFFTFANKVESTIKKGFYFIPYFPGYLINKDGDLWNIRYNKFNTKSITKRYNDGHNRKNGYIIYRARSHITNSTHVSRHRLLCLTFISYNNNPSNLVVNHKNGIPGDDRLSNLEWTTYSKNLIHALENGLMPNSLVPIKVFNFKTKKILTFKSIINASEALGITTSLISHRLRKKNVMYSDNILFYRKGDVIDVEKIRIGVEPVRISTTNTLNGVVEIFNSVEEASRTLNINPTSIRERYKTGSNKPIKGYIIKLLCYKHTCPDNK